LSSGKELDEERIPREKEEQDRRQEPSAWQGHLSSVEEALREELARPITKFQRMAKIPRA